MQTKRGQKKCPKCETINGVRSFMCKNKKCKFEFNVKRKLPKTLQVSNWRELKIGQKIKVLGRSGPYFLDKDGIKHYWSESGSVYIVYGLDKNGIQAYPVNGGGYTYLYMGKEKLSSITKSCYNAPHRLLIKNEAVS